MAYQGLEVHDFLPVCRAIEEHRDGAVELARLRQREDLEKLIEGAKAPRERNERVRQVREPELAHEKIMKLEAELGSDVAVRALLVRQANIEANAAPAGQGRATVGRLHDPGAAA